MSKSGHRTAAPWRYLGAVGVLFVAYFVTARLGLQIDPVGKFATFVWPPTGIALAILLLFGRRLWPGIFLGAFVVNWSLGASAPLALMIGLGNTLEALAGAYLLRASGFRNSLERVRDVLQLIFLGAFLSTVVSATIGTSALVWDGVIASTDYVRTWQTWWVGDALGALVIAPLILMVFRVPSRLGPRRRWVEGFLFLAALVALDAFVFKGVPALSAPYPLAPISYLLLLPLFWAALRFGPPATIASIFLTSAMAVWATVHDAGPFAGLSAGLSLLYLQLFIAVAAGTSMVLAATVSELQHAKIALSIANKRKDEFMAILGHELRNPLAVMSSSVEIAEIEGPSEDLLPAIRKQLGYIGRLLEDLLDASRISHGKIKLRVQTVDAKTVVAQAIASTGPFRESRRHELVLDLPPEPLLVEADPVRLEQVIINLLNNAAKYTDPGGRIWLALSRQKDHIVVKVRDSGIGIPAHALDDIFQPFSQLDRSFALSQGGLGLGLSLVKKLVELHGGRILVESEGLGKGAQFTVYFPAAKKGSGKA